jgi:hypothetical protein
MVDGTTMQAEDGWYGLLNIFPPSPGDPAKRAGLDLEKGHTVRVYTCSVCGYTETYSADVLDPAMWKV